MCLSRKRQRRSGGFERSGVLQVDPSSQSRVGVVTGHQSRWHKPCLLDGVHISHFLGIVPSNYTIASQWDMRDAGMRDMSVFSVFFCDLLEWDVS